MLNKALDFGQKAAKIQEVEKVEKNICQLGQPRVRGFEPSWLADFFLSSNFDLLYLCILLTKYNV